MPSFKSQGKKGSVILYSLFFLKVQIKFWNLSHSPHPVYSIFQHLSKVYWALNSKWRRKERKLPCVFLCAEDGRLLTQKKDKEDLNLMMNLTPDLEKKKRNRTPGSWLTGGAWEEKCRKTEQFSYFIMTMSLNFPNLCDRSRWGQMYGEKWPMSPS